MCDARRGDYLINKYRVDFTKKIKIYRELTKDVLNMASLDIIVTISKYYYLIIMKIMSLVICLIIHNNV